MNSERLFNKNFTLVVIGQIISLFGNAILRFALPLYLLRTTDSASIFGTVMAVSFIPIIIFSLMGGILADRVNKRNIMVTLDFLAALCMIGFHMLSDTLPIVPLIAVTSMVLAGISGTYQPVVQASIPALVPQSQLLKANALITQVGALANLIGPMLGGILFGVWGIMPIVILSICCFIFSAIMEIFIYIPHKKIPTSKSVFSMISQDLTETYIFTKNEKPIFFSISLISASFNLVLSSLIIIGIPILVIQTLNLSDQSLGFTQSVLALGGLFGGICAGIFHKKLSLKNAHLLLLTCSVAVFAMGVSLFMPIPIAYGIITAVSFMIMTASTLFSIQLFALIQQECPPHLIGKVMASIFAIALCSQPIGQGIYGILFKEFANNTWIILISASVLGIGVSLYSKRIFQNI